MLILCLDSSDRVLRTGLFEDDQCLSQQQSPGQGNHSGHIIKQIESTLADASKTIDYIDLCAINTGPGSFTGLRIGMSAMAGLALGKDIPLYGAGSFDIMLEDLNAGNARYMALIPCRGEEFYYCFYEARDGKCQRDGHPGVMRLEEINQLKVKLEVIGPGAAIWDQKIKNIKSDKLLLSKQITNIPSLNSLARLARQASLSDEGIKLGVIPELFYMAPSQAEINYARRQAGNC